jgi:hypothetical protein
MYNDTIKIIVIDEDHAKSRLSFMSFAKVLTDKTSKEVITKDYSILEGEGFHIRFILKNIQTRGMRCDYLINNTQDEEFHNTCALPMMNKSQFLRELR